MRILLDESVCLRLADALREDGHEVLAIAESAGKGLPDNDVWTVACEGAFLLITRDYHFTNAVRFDPALCLGTVFLRHGNLKASEEVTLVRSFLLAHPPVEYQGRLVTLSPGRIRIRDSL
jgi:predicted nuclease of predicted toxin-antitoxin system